MAGRERSQAAQGVPTPMENQSLVLDLVEWVARNPRPYEEVMEAWRTSCPRLAIWEDAVDRRLVTWVAGEQGESLVTASDEGRALLRACGRLV